MTKEGRNSCLFFSKFDGHILPQESPRWDKSDFLRAIKLNSVNLTCYIQAVIDYVHICFS